MADRKPVTAWLRSPAGILAGIGAIVILAILFAPTAKSVETPASLTSYSRDPNGARGFYEVLDRLDFTVDRWLRPMRSGLKPDETYLLLTTPIGLTTSETNALLAAVRAGASLMVLPESGTHLADSLKIVSSHIDDDVIGVSGRPSPGLNFQERLSAYVLRQPAGRDSVRLYRPPPDARLFETIKAHGAEPSIVGFAYGRGRVIAYANPELFRNSALRDLNQGVRAVRLVEWLVENKAGRPIWFDEYHHGYGTHADPLRTARRALVATQPGRMALQLGIAAFVLLLVVAIRPIRPRPALRIERRSPLEHVGALARAYAAVDAGERAARLLVRGVRRRQGALRGRIDEAAYLNAIRERHPETGPAVELVVAALRGHNTDPDELAAAISRIERGLHR